MQPITAIFILLTMKALLLSAACINQTAPQETAAPAPVAPSGPGVFLTTPSPTLPTMTPPAAAATVTTTLVPMTPIQINDIISLDNNLYYVYAEDSSVYYLREVEENADGSGYVYAGASAGTGIRQSLDYVNTHARYLDHVDPYGSDAVRSKTTS